MNECDKAYYIAAGRSLEAVLKWRDEQSDIQIARRKFLDRFGTEKFMRRGGRFTGLLFDDKPNSPPPGFREDTKSEYRYFYVPALKTAEGKAVAKEMELLGDAAIPDDIGELEIFDSHWHTPGIQKLNRKWVISTHVKSRPPLDAVPLSRADYWKMAESKRAAVA